MIISSSTHNKCCEPDGFCKSFLNNFKQTVKVRRQMCQLLLLSVGLSIIRNKHNMAHKFSECPMDYVVPNFPQPSNISFVNFFVSPQNTCLLHLYMII